MITRFSIRILLFISILAVALETLFYLSYSDWTRAVLIESQNGFFFDFAEVALIDLAARSTPKGCEGLGYALILSVTNVASFGADVVGSQLADNHWPFAHRGDNRNRLGPSAVPAFGIDAKQGRDSKQRGFIDSASLIGGDIRDRVIRIGPQPRARSFVVIQASIFRCN